MTALSVKRRRIRAACAREAERLAMECATGTAPHMIAGRLYEHGERCALGVVLSRAGRCENPWDFYREMIAVGGVTRDNGDQIASRLVIEANNGARDDADRMERLVFPLLMLADGAMP